MLRFFRRRSAADRPHPAAPWRLDAPLLRWPEGDDWTLADAFAGTLILGATGSGKSSGSGRTLALRMLAAGFGGLVLTAKADERAAWEAYCREARRSDDLLIFDAGAALRFNFLDYELNRPGAGSGHTENIVNVFSTVLEVAERNGPGGGREDEGYWKRALRQLLRNLVDLLSMATGAVSVPDLYRLAISAPTSVDQARSQPWRESSFCFACLQRADALPRSPRQESDFALVADYFLVEFPALSDKTRSVILSTFTSMADVLNRGLLRELFCTDTNVTPTAVEQGKIVLFDLPAKEFSEVGVFAQVLWKFAFQRSIERRVVNDDTRPAFLWADEAQHFITRYDMQFQTTCRAARVATVYLTQNVSNVYAALGGGEKGRAEADSLFGNLCTKVLHANGDPTTNEWAATLIGRTRQCLASGNTTQPADWVSHALGLGGSAQSSGGFSEAFEFELQPAVFTRLRSGGVSAEGWIDAIVVRSGRRFSDGRIWKRVTFRQELDRSKRAPARGTTTDA